MPSFSQAQIAALRRRSRALVLASLGQLARIWAILSLALLAVAAVSALFGMPAMTPAVAFVVLGCVTPIFALLAAWMIMSSGLRSDPKVVAGLMTGLRQERLRRGVRWIAQLGPNATALTLRADNTASAATAPSEIVLSPQLREQLLAGQQVIVLCDANNIGVAMVDQKF